MLEMIGGNAVCSGMASTIYNLTVDSDLDLPELRRVDGEHIADLVIRQGPVAQPNPADGGSLAAYIAGGPGRLWLNIPSAVRLAITDGHHITYERYPGAEDDELRLFILGSGLGAIMMQRGQILIHGNAIVTGDQRGAIICIGDSGAGKSTTAVAMMRRGLQVLTDDLCPLTDDGTVLPGMPRAKLWQDTAQAFGIDTRPLARIRRADAKFNLPLGSAHCTESQPVRAFYWLAPDDVAEVSVEPVRGAAAFAILRNNVYRPEFLQILGLEEDYLRRLAAIGTRTPVFKIARPKTGFTVDAVVDAILANDEKHRKDDSVRI